MHLLSHVEMPRMCATCHRMVRFTGTGSRRFSGLDDPLGHTPERASHQFTPGRMQLYLTALPCGIFIASALGLSAAKIPHLEFRAEVVKRFGPKPSDLQRRSAAAPALSADEACVLSRGLSGPDSLRRACPCCCARPCEACQDRAHHRDRECARPLVERARLAPSRGLCGLTLFLPLHHWSRWRL